MLVQQGAKMFGVMYELNEFLRGCLRRRRHRHTEGVIQHAMYGH